MEEFSRMAGISRPDAPWCSKNAVAGRPDGESRFSIWVDPYCAGAIGRFPWPNGGLQLIPLAHVVIKRMDVLSQARRAGAPQWRQA